MGKLTNLRSKLNTIFQGRGYELIPKPDMVEVETKEPLTERDVDSIKSLMKNSGYKEHYVKEEDNKTKLCFKNFSHTNKKSNMKLIIQYKSILNTVDKVLEVLGRLEGSITITPSLEKLTVDCSGLSDDLKASLILSITPLIDGEVSVVCNQDLEEKEFSKSFGEIFIKEISEKLGMNEAEFIQEYNAMGSADQVAMSADRKDIKKLTKVLDRESIHYNEDDILGGVAVDVLAEDYFSKGTEEDTKSFSAEEINTEEEFGEYAEKVLKEAHKDNYDEEIAKETISGILEKSTEDGTIDFGAAIGRLTSGLAN